MTKEGVLFQDARPSIEAIERENAKSTAALLGELKPLREICDRAIDPGFGYHPNYDREKHFCALFSYGLMRDLSKRAITGTKDEAFRAIASLLYETISGHRDADLKRACDSILRDIRGRNQGTN
jgi:hypothetical protein